MNFKKKILVGGILAIFGILLVASPEKIFQAIVIFMGIVSIFDAILILKTERVLLDDVYYRRTALARGIIGILIGLAAILYPIFVTNFVFNLAFFTLGFYFLLSGNLELIALIRLKNNGFEISSYLMETVSLFIAAAVMFFLILIGGFELISVVLRILGIIFILSGVLVIILAIKQKPLVVEAQVVDDSENDAESKND